MMVDMIVNDEYAVSEYNIVRVKASAIPARLMDRFSGQGQVLSHHTFSSHQLHFHGSNASNGDVVPHGHEGQ